jgi:hypothetical protein
LFDLFCLDRSQLVQVGSQELRTLQNRKFNVISEIRAAPRCSTYPDVIVGI